MSHSPADVTFPTLEDLVRDYKISYEKWGHKLLRIKLSGLAPHEKVSLGFGGWGLGVGGWGLGVGGWGLGVGGWVQV